MSDVIDVTPYRIDAAGPSDMDAVRELFVEYANSLGFSLCFQGFDRESADLPGCYAMPDGRLVLARCERDVAGLVGLRRLSAGVCEMKRLYVRPAHRRHGLGRQLAERVIDEARSTGYRTMRLDTLAARMPQAVTLYKTLGFVEIPPYSAGAPVELTCFELALS